MATAWPSRNSFDMQSSSTIFWDTVPVSLRESGQKEVAEKQLTFRVLLGQRNDGTRMPVLWAYIFNDLDSQFLQALEVSEDDFQTLKAEQGILVDFQNFSGKMTDLLMQCIASKDESTPRFRAILCICSSDTHLKLVETNEFKQIPHICLTFRSGSDSEIKEFLAFRLAELKYEHDSLLGQLSNTRAELQAAIEESQGQRQQLISVEASHERLMMEATVESKDLRVAAHHELVKLREDLMCSHEREKSRMQQAHQHEVNSMSQQNVELQEQLSQICEDKHLLERQLTEVLHKYSASEKSMATSKDEITSLQEQVKVLSREKRDLETECTNLIAQVSALDERLPALEQAVQQHQVEAEKHCDVVKQQTIQLHDLRSECSHLACVACEASEEVAKGNQIIHDLTRDLKVSRDKLKKKQEMLSRQDENMTEMEQEVRLAKEKLRESEDQVLAVQSSLQQMQMSEKSLTGKLRICKEQLAANEQMIRWLNSQVNDAQIHGACATRLTMMDQPL